MKGGRCASQSTGTEHHGDEIDGLRPRIIQSHREGRVQPINIARELVLVKLMPVRASCGKFQAGRIGSPMMVWRFTNAKADTMTANTSRTNSRISPPACFPQVGYPVDESPHHCKTAAQSAMTPASVTAAM